jgi:hypothetical protein
VSVGREEEYSFEKYFDTIDGTLWAQSKVITTRFDITYMNFTLYPVTSARDQIRVSELMQVFHWLVDDARQRGYQVITLQASRKRPGKPERMLNITRRLS